MSVCLPAHKRLPFMSLTRPAGQNCLDCIFKTVRQACWDLSIWCNLYQADACFQRRPPGWRSLLEYVQKTSQNISYLHYLFSVKSTVFSMLVPWRGELDMLEGVSFYLSWDIYHFSTHLSPVALQGNFSLLTTAAAWKWRAEMGCAVLQWHALRWLWQHQQIPLLLNWLFKTEILSFSSCQCSFPTQYSQWNQDKLSSKTEFPASHWQR